MSDQIDRPSTLTQIKLVSALGRGEQKRKLNSFTTLISQLNKVKVRSFTRQSQDYSKQILANGE